MTTPVAEMLRRTYPNAHIAWVVEEKSKDAVIGNPYLDEVIVWKRHSGKYNPLLKAVDFMSSLEKLRRLLRSRKFDVSLDFQGLFRSGLVGLMSGARYRFGGSDAREGAPLLYNRRVNIGDLPEHKFKDVSVRAMSDAFCKWHSMFFPIEESDRAFADQYLASVATGEGNRGFVGMCPATTWPQKHWTEDGWARLADLISTRYGLTPVFLGSNADKVLIERISSKMKCEFANAAGLTTLKQSAAILEKCRLVVAVDTGLLHISMALGRPVVGLFGPTGWSHFSASDKFVPVSKNCECSPCLRHPDCKEFVCMRDISADDVIEAAGALLSG